MKTRLQNLISRLRRDVHGGVAIMAGLAIPMIFLGLGGAVDYTRATADNQKAQRILDSVVLSLTKLDPDEVDLQEQGRKLFASSIRNSGLRATSQNVEFNITRMRVEGSASLTHQTTFLGLIGVSTMNGSVFAAAVPPEDRVVEIALALDVSGSMSQDLNGGDSGPRKIDLMISAANTMFDTLDETLGLGTRLSASVVPYSSAVNLTDFPNALEDSSLGRGEAKPTDEDLWATERLVASNGNGYILNTKSPSVRRFPFHVESELRFASPSSRLAPLNDNIDAVRSKINALTPGGFTAGHIGMAWGLYTLAPEWANFWPTRPANYGRSDKIIVLLSDGQFNATYNIGDSLDSFDNENFSLPPIDRFVSQTDNQLESDSYFQEICELARDNDIKIFAVALALDAASQQRLMNCVGATGFLFLAETAGELTDAFKTIARSLGERRLAG